MLAVFCTRIFLTGCVRTLLTLYIYATDLSRYF